MGSFFKPADQRGFTYDSFDGVIAEAVYAMWKSPGSKYEESCCVRISWMIEDRKFPIREHISIGRGYKPTADGKSIEVTDPKNEGKGIDRRSAFAFFVREALAKGVPEDRIPGEDNPYDLSWLLGIGGHWEKKKSYAGQKGKGTIVLDDLHELDAAYELPPPPTASEKKAAVTKAATKRTKPAEAPEAESSSTDLLALAEKTLAEIVAELSEPITLQQYKIRVFKQLLKIKDLPEAVRNELNKLMASDEFLVERTSYDGAKVAPKEE